MEKKSTLDDMFIFTPYGVVIVRKVVVIEVPVETIGIAPALEEASL